MSLCSNSPICLAEADFFGLDEGECGLGGVDAGVGDLVSSLFVEGDAGEGVRRNLEGLVGAVDETEEGFFDELEVAVVAGGHFEGDVLDGLKFGGGLGGMASDEFKDIGVSFLGHDAGAGRDVIGESDEGEFLRVVKAEIGGEAAEILHDEAEA